MASVKQMRFTVRNFFGIQKEAEAGMKVRMRKNIVTKKV